MKTYIIVYDDFTFGVCTYKGRGTNIREVIDEFEFMSELNPDNIISITVAR